jgi:hypothetical protein
VERWFRIPSGLPGGKGAWLLLLVIVLWALPGPARAKVPYPLYGVRVVDGDPSDWHLKKDFYADMYRAGKTDKVVESKLYLRYDCPTNTLYVLVLAEPGVPIIARRTDGAWVAIDGISYKVVNAKAGNDGSPPDFAWVTRPNGSVQDGLFAIGYEASFILMPGSHSILVHADVLDDYQVQTSATALSPKQGLPIIVDCTVPIEQESWGKVKSMYR